MTLSLNCCTCPVRSANDQWYCTATAIRSTDVYDRTSYNMKANDDRKLLFTRKCRSLENISLIHAALTQHVRIFVSSSPLLRQHLGFDDFLEIRRENNLKQTRLEQTQNALARTVVKVLSYHSYPTLSSLAQDH